MNFASIASVAHPLADAAAGALIASVWQGMLLVVVVAICLQMLKGLSASVRSAIWAVTLAFVAILPVISFAAPSFAGRGSGKAAIAPIHLQESWSLAFICIWILLSAIRALSLLRSVAYLRTVSKDAVQVSAPGLIEELLTQGPRPVRLCTSALIKRPCVAGFSHPRILVPAGLLPTLSDGELEQVVRHELEHLRRRDDWTNLLQQTALVLFPLNPAIAWIDRRLAADRELACDDAVLQATGARKAYAACLARIAEHAMLSRGVALAVALVGRRGRHAEITQRVERILAAPPRRMTVLQIRSAVALLSVCGIGAATVIARSPQLVSFRPAMNTIAGAGQVAFNVAPSAPNQELGARPRMVKAVMPSAGAPRLLRARMSMRRPARRTDPVHLQSMRQETVFEAVQRHEPVQPAVRQTLTAFRVSQTQYAAIRFADGWLIVQL